MNKFAAVGLLLEAEAGRRVIVVTDVDHVGETLETFVPFLPAGSRVLRTKGAERIRLQSGIDIRVLTPGRMRGHAGDVVFLEGTVAGTVSTPYARLLVSSSPDGEVVHA